MSKIIYLLLICFLSIKINAQLKEIKIRNIAPNKFLFILPNTKKRIIKLKYLESNKIIEKITELDSFVFINNGKELGLCGMFEFNVYNFKTNKNEFKSKRYRHCCN